MGLGQPVFTYHPGHSFNLDTTTRAINPPWCIDEKHLMTPHRDVLETSLRQRIVTGPFASAAAANRAAVRAGPYLNLKGWNRCPFNKTNRSIDKGFEFLHAIEDSLDLHPVPFALLDGVFALPSSQSGGRMHYP